MQDSAHLDDGHTTSNGHSAAPPIAAEGEAPQSRRSNTSRSDSGSLQRDLHVNNASASSGSTSHSPPAGKEARAPDDTAHHSRPVDMTAIQVRQTLALRRPLPSIQAYMCLLEESCRSGLLFAQPAYPNVALHDSTAIVRPSVQNRVFEPSSVRVITEGQRRAAYAHMVPPDSDGDIWRTAQTPQASDLATNGTFQAPMSEGSSGNSGRLVVQKTL